MNWHNLKNNKCPKCNTEFSLENCRDKSIKCLCGFSISEQRFSEIVSGMTSQKIDRETLEDNK